MQVSHKHSPAGKSRPSEVKAQGGQTDPVRSEARRVDKTQCGQRHSVARGQGGKSDPARPEAKEPQRQVRSDALCREVRVYLPDSPRGESGEVEAHQVVTKSEQFSRSFFRLVQVPGGLTVRRGLDGQVKRLRLGRTVCLSGRYPFSQFSEANTTCVSRVRPRTSRSSIAVEGRRATDQTHRQGHHPKDWRASGLDLTRSPAPRSKQLQGTNPKTGHSRNQPSQANPTYLRVTSA